MSNNLIFKNGSPFGSIITDKLYSYNDKLESISYKLKVKTEFFIYFLISVILIPLIFYKKTRVYTILITLNYVLYLMLLENILPRFFVLKLPIHYLDIILSSIFLIIAYILSNQKILPTILFFIVNTMSFFVIEPIALNYIKTFIFFNDIPILYHSLIAVISDIRLKTIIILLTVVYFLLILYLIIFFIYNLIKMNRYKSIFLSILIIILVFVVFFRPVEIITWDIDFYRQIERYGIINTISYKISYDKINNEIPSKKEVENAIMLLKDLESNRDISALILNGSQFENRDVFLVFLESFYDYSHFVELFDEDPFGIEYRQWASNSHKIPPSITSGSFYARLSGLTASSPLYPKSQISKIENSLPDLLVQNGYYAISLEESISTYNLNSFFPMLGFNEEVFALYTGNLNLYISTNMNNLQKPLFASCFTLLGHDGMSPKDEDKYILGYLEKNKRFIDLFDANDKDILIQTFKDCISLSREVIKIRDTILKFSPNALIIFKNDHMFPNLIEMIRRSKIDEKIKSSFLEDQTPTPILIWDGTNGSYKAPINFVPENIPLFIALNAGVTNYNSTMISLLYKDEMDGNISTYHKFYSITNDRYMLLDNIDTNSNLYKYENARKILSQDIFLGKKYYYDLIKSE